MGDKREGEWAGWRKSGGLIAAFSAGAFALPFVVWRAGVALWHIMQYVIPGGVITK